jgi:hypothetical protein
MMHSSTLKRILLPGVVALGFSLSAAAQTADQIIAKARAYLGGDAALSALTSVHFSGAIEPGKAAPGAAQPTKVGIDIIFQKPDQQRIVATGAASTETTALDGYTAWQRVQEAQNPDRWKLTVLGPELIKRLRANTWENLNFFKDIGKSGGTVDVVGPATVDGRPAVKLAFRHDASIVFFRYFDPETGRLVLTETQQGGSIREEGEIMVNGLRFPQKTVEVAKGVDAKGQPIERTTVVVFDKITVNETFPSSYFETPLLTPPNQPQASPSNPTPAAASAGK